MTARKDPLDRISDLTYEALAAEAQQLRARIDRFRTALGRHFVAKQPIVDLMCVGAIAQEPVLLVGPPGTAKSELVLKFKDALGLEEGDYFEYMLTRFTEPSEVIGPIDLDALRAGRYVRRHHGKLPDARVVFLDEIFKSNSAILNALLTLINERKFYQDGRPLPVKLKILFAATNEVPPHAELGALRDRFCLKVPCGPVQETHFLELLDLGLASQVARDLGQKPWAEGHATLVDFLKAHRYLTLQLASAMSGIDGAPQGDRARFFPDALLKELRRLIRTLVREEKLFVSDRKIVKLYRLLRTRAWLLHGGVVEKEDLLLLAYLGESADELERLAERVPKLLGIDAP